MKIALDTNFWIYLSKYRLFDKLREMNLEPILLGPVKSELEHLSKGNKEGVNAGVALEMIKKWGVKETPIKEKVADRAIFKFALGNKGRVKVATMDKELSDMLKKEGIEVVKIRQKKDFL